MNGILFVTNAAPLCYVLRRMPTRLQPTTSTGPSGIFLEAYAVSHHLTTSGPLLLAPLSLPPRTGKPLVHTADNASTAEVVIIVYGGIRSPSTNSSTGVLDPALGTLNDGMHQAATHPFVSPRTTSPGGSGTPTVPPTALKLPVITTTSPTTNAHNNLATVVLAPQQLTLSLEGPPANTSASLLP